MRDEDRSIVFSYLVRQVAWLRKDHAEDLVYLLEMSSTQFHNGKDINRYFRGVLLTDANELRQELGSIVTGIDPRNEIFSPGWRYALPRLVARLNKDPVCNGLPELIYESQGTGRAFTFTIHFAE